MKHWRNQRSRPFRDLPLDIEPPDVDPPDYDTDDHDWDEPIIKCNYCDAPGHYGFECPRAAEDEAEGR
jgi:hypothetical protein